ncbi:MAG: hypothetical protein Q9160_004222 [Pyrenula sp. 1 TL-2023]
MSCQLAELRKSILALSREQYLLYASIVMKQDFDKLVVGAAIIQSPATNPKLDEPLILLLRRNADEEYYPDVFEIPGGKVNDIDPSIGDALRREVQEETDLAVTRVLDMLPDLTYVTEKALLKRNSDGEEKMVKKSCIQLSFTVDVASLNFRPNPAEHSGGVWASKDMLNHLKMTTEMRRLAYMTLNRDAGCRLRHFLM